MVNVLHKVTEHRFDNFTQFRATVANHHNTDIFTF